jgi:hypothetical protein
MLLPLGIELFGLTGQLMLRQIQLLTGLGDIKIKKVIILARMPLL